MLWEYCFAVNVLDNALPYNLRPGGIVEPEMYFKPVFGLDGMIVRNLESQTPARDVDYPAIRPKVADPVGFPVHVRPGVLHMIRLAQNLIFAVQKRFFAEHIAHFDCHFENMFAETLEPESVFIVQPVGRY